MLPRYAGMPVCSSVLNGPQRRTLACTRLARYSAACSTCLLKIRPGSHVCGSALLQIWLQDSNRCRLQAANCWGSASHELSSAGARDVQGACLDGLLLAGCSVRLQRGPGNLCHGAATCNRHDTDITMQLKATLAHAADMVRMVTRLKTMAASRQSVWGPTSMHICLSAGTSCMNCAEGYDSPPEAVWPQLPLCWVPGCLTTGQGTAEGCLLG